MADKIMIPTQGAAPSSEQAEEAVIGSVMLDSSSYASVGSFLKTDDFFLVRHRHIWTAIERLVQRGEKIDYLTTAEELENLGVLADVGGAGYLLQLVNNTPTTMFVEVYGRLVQRTAIRRRLLETAQQISKLAYDERIDLEVVIREAETALFKVTEQQTQREFTPLWKALELYYTRMELLMNQGGGALGVPSGFRDLDYLLGGFQRSDLIVFAGRPGMGKTSFLLSAAMNAARLNARIAIFTMEMGVEQLVQRMVAMETGINVQKLRLAQLDLDENARMMEAIARIGNFKIFIDDTPAMNPMEIRTKCRRLAFEHGLDMVIIDYMQLMNAGKAYENNRVQEISFISRSLKELARELNVPVMSAAQLSRAVEQRQDKRPVLSDLRESGCLAGDALVYLLDGGISVPIRELVESGQMGFRVLAINTETWQFEPATVTHAFCTGVKPVYKLTTALGRTIRATANHLFLTIDGWQRLDHLREKDHIAVPRHLVAENTVSTMGKAEIALLGHLLGDGCTLPSHAIQYTTTDLDLAEIVAGLATEVFGNTVAVRIHKEPHRNWYQVFFSGGGQKRNPMSVWLEQLGVWGLRSYEKIIPDTVFSQPTDLLAIFLRHLWSTDGCIWVSSKNARQYLAIYYATSSLHLATGVQSILLRLGINAQLRHVSQGDKGRMQYHVSITGIPDVARFVSLGAVGSRKQSALANIESYVQTHEQNTNRDIIPKQIYPKYVIPAMKKNQLSTRLMQKRMGSQYCGTSYYKRNLSRERAMLLAEVVGSHEVARLAQSDVYWDTIISIEAESETEVYDLTVTPHHNFIANNMIVHNSIEQDSDIVMFLYRDEVYNEATEYPNQADVIVAKHRNGPTGTISLYFEKSLTKFMDALHQRVELSDLG